MAGLRPVDQGIAGQSAAGTTCSCANAGFLKNLSEVICKVKRMTNDFECSAVLIKGDNRCSCTESDNLSKDPEELLQDLSESAQKLNRAYKEYTKLHLRDKRGREKQANIDSGTGSMIVNSAAFPIQVEGETSQDTNLNEATEGVHITKL